MTAVAQHPNLIGGDFRAAESGRWMEVRDPADADVVVGSVPEMSAADVAKAYAESERGARTWAAASSIERGRVLMHAAAILRERREEVARDLTAEMGKTIAEARGEVDKSADFLEYYGGLGRAPLGEVLPHESGDVRVWTRHEPLGVVLAITPWNDPLLTPARKLAPALIAGNAVVLKPASYTPIVAGHLARALADAGLPAGVLNTVTGPAAEIAEALLDAEALSAVSFTGSNDVCDRLRGSLAGRDVELLAELGGKNAAVVLGDADFDLAAETIAAAAFAQAGQRCTATSRVIVESGALEPLAERLTAAARAHVLGPGIDATTTLGPLVAEEQRRVVLGFVDRAREAGAEVLAGGGVPDDERRRRGSYVEPTVLAGVGPEMEVWREEVFGPVIALQAVDGLAAAIEAVDASRYGLAAALYTRDLGAVEAFVDGVAVGQLAVNLPTSGWDVHMPFGGFKASGLGPKEQGTDVLRFYTRTKTVAVRAARAEALR